MDRDFCERFNTLIQSVPSLALAELQLKQHEQDTLFDEIERIASKVRVPKPVIQRIEEQAVRGDFQAMRLPSYQPKIRFPFTPAARQRERARKDRYERASRDMDRRREWCLQRKAQGWTMAEILFQEKVKNEEEKV